MLNYFLSFFFLIEKREIFLSVDPQAFHQMSAPTSVLTSWQLSQIQFADENYGMWLKGPKTETKQLVILDLILFNYTITRGITLPSIL